MIKNVKCPFCNGKLVGKSTLDLILVQIKFKKRYICKDCKSICLKR